LLTSFPAILSFIPGQFLITWTKSGPPAAARSRMNWLRSLLGLVGVLFSFKGRDSYYQTEERKA
jgi:hypothetical protein